MPHSQAYTETLEADLFESLSNDARHEYSGELGGTGGDQGKIQAVHSSSVICCNLLHYRRRLGARVDVIAQACELPKGARGVTLERHLPFDAERFRHVPDLDALFDRSRLTQRWTTTWRKPAKHVIAPGVSMVAVRKRKQIV